MRGVNDLYFNMMMYLGCHVVDVFLFVVVVIFLILFFVVVFCFVFLVWLSLQHGCVVFRLLS